MFSAASICMFVCLFVCEHDFFRTSKHRMMKLGGWCIIRPSSNLGVIAPLGVHPQKCGIGKISTGCLVLLNVIDAHVPDVIRYLLSCVLLQPRNLLYSSELCSKLFNVMLIIPG